MKKNKIFDIEEVGFGDEYTKKHPFKKNQKSKPKQMKKLVKSTEFKMGKYRPREFVSPITGRSLRRPGSIIIAHGEFVWINNKLIKKKERLQDNEAIPAEKLYLRELEDQPAIVAPISSQLEDELIPKEEITDSTVKDQKLTVATSRSMEVKHLERDLVAPEPILSAELELEIVPEEAVIDFKMIETKSDYKLVVDDFLEEKETISFGGESDFENDSDFYAEGLVNTPPEGETPYYYEIPSFDLLDGPAPLATENEDWIIEKMTILEQTFANFGVGVLLTGEFIQGATVTQIEIQPESGTKMSKILGLYNDLKLNLSVEELRIEPIPGKNTIGIEIPNLERRVVKLQEILSRPEFVLHESPLYIGLGEDISGAPVYADILAMPHGLVAGQTGSGKSVCINTLLLSILYKASPEDVRLMLIDPKRVEMAPYNEIPHLVTPVITDEKKAAVALKWAVEEMERRYELFAANGVREIKAFNSRRHEFAVSLNKLPYIVIIIDELADLMMVAATEVEDYIMRITQKARAAGIHMIIATQRPTVDVITGTIKSNIPSRIAFAVAQANDSRVILDENGAQNLLGYGDMLLAQSGSKLKRVQGSYVSSEEIDRVIDVVKTQSKPTYLIEDQFLENKLQNNHQAEDDPLLEEAMDLVFERGYATASALQTKLRIGYNRAARIIDTLEQKGWIGKPQGSIKKREIKITREEFEGYFALG